MMFKGGQPWVLVEPERLAFHTGNCMACLTNGSLQQIFIMVKDVSPPTKQSGG